MIRAKDGRHIELVKQSRCDGRSVAYVEGRASMPVQIFGTRKCKDTQKAVRFFKERRVQIHLVDLDERPASPGELRRFFQKFGVESLLDRDGKRFRDRGLHAAHLPGARVQALLEEDSRLLRTPLVRSGNRLSIGYTPEDWKAMVEVGA